MKKVAVVGLVIAFLVLPLLFVPISTKTLDHVFTEEPKARYSLIKGEKTEYDNFVAKSCPINASCAGGSIELRLYLLW